MSPKSNVGIPLAVVMRSMSSAPVSAMRPPPKKVKGVPALLEPNVWEEVQILLPSVASINVPESASACWVLLIFSPSVLLAATADEGLNLVDVDTYPVVSTVPVPTRIRKSDAPVWLTLLNKTVIRVTQLGIPVKSIDVPLVEATAVPELIVGP